MLCPLFLPLTLEFAELLLRGIADSFTAAAGFGAVILPMTDFDVLMASCAFGGDAIATGASFFAITGFFATISFGGAAFFGTNGFNLKFPFGLLILEAGRPTFGNLNGTLLLPCIESSSKNSNRKHFLGYFKQII